MKKVLFFLMLAAALHGQTVVAKYAGEFMAIGVGGRSLGLGGAFSAIANDVTAAYYNPAGLALIKYPQIALMHDERYGNLVNYNYAAAAYPFNGDYTFAVSITRLAVDGIPDTRQAWVDKLTGQVIYDINNPNGRIDESKVKEISNQDWVFYLSGAKKFSDDLSFGLNVKLISRSIGEFSAFGVGFDIGALYKYTPDFRLAASVQDATTTLVAWSTGRKELISPTLKLGGMYDLFLFGNNFCLTPTFDLDLRFENRQYASIAHIGPVSIDPHAGAEISYQNLAAFRIGYNDVKQLTFGAGIRLPKLNIDYSFARFGGSDEERLGDTHRISVMLTLEEARFTRK